MLATRKARRLWCSFLDVGIRIVHGKPARTDLMLAIGRDLAAETSGVATNRIYIMASSLQSFGSLTDVVSDGSKSIDSNRESVNRDAIQDSFTNPANKTDNSKFNTGYRDQCNASYHTLNFNGPSLVRPGESTLGINSSPTYKAISETSKTTIYAQ